MQALHHFEVHAGQLADIPRGDQLPVVAEHPVCRQHERCRDGGPDVLKAEAFLDQPCDQLGTFSARRAVEAVEQTQRLEFDVVCSSGTRLIAVCCHAVNPIRPTSRAARNGVADSREQTPRYPKTRDLRYLRVCSPGKCGRNHAEIDRFSDRYCIHSWRPSVT